MSTPKTFTADVVQFLRPSGKKSYTSTELPIALRPLYEAMTAAGCRFEAEILSNGFVSATISNSEMDVDCSVTGNGSQVQNGMADMLKRKQWEHVPQEESP